MMNGHMIHAKSADLNTIWDNKTDFSEISERLLINKFRAHGCWRKGVNDLGGSRNARKTYVVGRATTVPFHT